jgi:molybdopterin molybdotransferase
VGAADLVLVCGATSAGRTDRLRGLLADAGAQLVVGGVDCRPGHPQLLALLPGGRPLIGLPGNPFAALGAALILGRAVLAALGGRSLPALPLAHLGGPATPPERRTRLVPVRWSGAEVVPLPRCASGSLRAAALADAVAVLDPDRDPTAPVPLLTLT